MVHGLPTLRRINDEAVARASLRMDGESWDEIGKWRTQGDILPLSDLAEESGVIAIQRIDHVEFRISKLYKSVM